MGRIRPSKPAAIFGALFGAAILVYGVVQIGSKAPSGFFWLWLVAGIAIIVFNLWAAFAKRGAVQVYEEDRTSDDRGR
ncbi:hypothetical protein CLV43_108404 [Umezawaea tangerina]|uniref:Uncharacterized protein n=1 Tax=Umezawaea tangerina TaxID=84725 RepID=A0A2T0T040_9PSEU|nr:hypothetical protein CLV43_108404 [Umezawaea tangerina]